MLHAAGYMHDASMLHAAFLKISKLLLIKFLGCNHLSYKESKMISNHLFLPVIANSGGRQHLCTSFARIVYNIKNARMLGLYIIDNF